MNLGRVLILFIKVVIFLPCCFFILWWAYSMSAQGKGGFPENPEAFSLTLKMSLLMTAFASVIWFASPIIHKQKRWVGLAIKIALETAAILAIYGVIVVAWRNSWAPEKGMSEAAAFIPIVGHVNAAFFAEYGFLEYFIVVLPLVSAISGSLSLFFDFIQSRGQLRER